MRAQITDEEIKELTKEVELDPFKAAHMPRTVLGRKRFRDLRIALHNLDIHVDIPYRDALFTDAYCKMYAPEEQDWHKLNLDPS